MKPLSIFIPFLLLCNIVLAQNTPNLGETSPSGSITNPILKKPVAYTVPQTPKHNYVRTWVPQKPMSDASLLNENTTPDNTTQATDYTDGLGNGLEQIVRYGISPSYHSVSFSDPREIGTENYKFMPYAVHYSQGTGFRYNMIGEQETYYNTKFPNEGNTAYSQNIITWNGAGIQEVRAMAAGKSQVGQGRGSQTSTYLQNNAGSTRKWTLDANGFPVTNGTYGNSELMYTIITGEHGMEVRKYTDKEGKAIATKVVSDAANSVTEVTYNIFDEQGRVVITLTPKAVQKIEQNAWVVTQDILDNLCIRVTYDELGRITSKTTPGKEGLEKIVYDKWERPVLTQDANLALQNQWIFSIFDDMGRAAFTGKLTSTENQGWWQYLMDGTGAVPANAMPNNADLADAGKIYTYLLNGFHNIQGAQAYPATIANADILRYNYYDHYSHTPLSGFAFDQNYLNDLYPDTYTIAYAQEPELRTMPVRGLMTGYKEKILKVAGSTSKLADWVTGVMYYNNKGQVIQTQRKIDKVLLTGQVSNIYLDINTTMYDFKGRVVRTVLYHNNKTVSGTPGNYTYTQDITTIAQKYQYQLKTFKLIAVRQKINTQDWMNLSVLNYDLSTGQLLSKDIGGVETQSYKYNIRGQLTGINAPYAETGITQPNVTFGESIKYDYGFSQKRYDGTISGIIWKTPTPKRRAYGYSYTEAGRLKGADFRQLEGTDATVNGDWKITSTDLSEKEITYDYNGNITHLKRQGPTTVNNFDMDNLTYTYANNDISNRLLKVTDGVNYMPSGLIQDFQNGTSGNNDDYTYDKNGNMASDKNKNISSATYNYLNKPEKVTFADNTRLEYVYTAGGEKLEELMIPATGSPEKTTYTGTAIYVNDVINNILHSEGKARRVGTGNPVSYAYDFFVKDHLGNVRSLVTAEEVPFQNYFATHELAYANMENLVFDNMLLVNQPRPGASNYDNNRAAKLDAADPDKRIGTALLMHVMAGDKFSVSAEAYYSGDTTGQHGTVSPQDMLASITDLLMNNQGGSSSTEGLPAEEVIPGAFTATNYTGTFQGLLDNMTDPGHPKSYLNYMVFDENMNLVPEQSGALQIGAAGSWHTLETLNDIEITQGGYLSVFISNASTEYITNYDNILIKYYKGSLREETHYYPYGMALQISPAVPTANKNLYQGKELTRKAGTNAYNIYNFEARQYDPLLGRFTSIDAMGQFASGYVGMGDNPVTGIDPDGNWRTDVENYSLLMSYNVQRISTKQQKKQENEMLLYYASQPNDLLWASSSEYMNSMSNSFAEAEQQMEARQEMRYTNSLIAELRELLPPDASLINIPVNDLEKLLLSLNSGADIEIIGDGKSGKIFDKKEEMEDYIISTSRETGKEVSAHEFVKNGKTIFYASPFDQNTTHKSTNEIDEMYLDNGWGYLAQYHTHPQINDSKLFGTYIPNSLYIHEGGSAADREYAERWNIPVFVYELKTQNIWFVSNNSFNERGLIMTPPLFIAARFDMNNNVNFFLSNVYGRIIGTFNK